MTAQRKQCPCCITPEERLAQEQQREILERSERPRRQDHSDRFNEGVQRESQQEYFGR